MAHEDVDDGFVPARSLLRFLADASQFLERADFTFQAIDHAPNEDVGSWGRLIPGCWRLRDALSCFCRHITLDAPFVKGGLCHTEDHVWFWRRRHLSSRDVGAEIQGEIFTLASAVKIVRAYAGRSWKPPIVQSGSQPSSVIPYSQALEGTEVRFGGRTLALAIPYDLLDLHLPDSPPIPPSSESNALPRAATDLSGSLQQAITPILGMNPTPCLEVAAEIAEMSVRTLRRRLDSEGSSWQRILDRARFEESQKLMRKAPGASLREIAAELGYADQAHFTRAFHRWTGESPSEYRRRRLLSASRSERALHN
jgi:AraC-like DNA-binding protein